MPLPQIEGCVVSLFLLCYRADVNRHVDCLRSDAVSKRNTSSALMLTVDGRLEGGDEGRGGDGGGGRGVYDRNQHDSSQVHRNRGGRHSINV